MIITEMEEKHVFPFENRIFVCIGKLKETKANHVWVMSISDDYKDVTFWEPKLFKKFVLKGRIDESEKIRNFLYGKYPDYDSVKKNRVEIKEKEEEIEDDFEENKNDKNRNYDERQPVGLNENDVVEYKNQDDNYQDYVINEKEILLGNLNVAGDAEDLTKKKCKIF